MACLITWLEHYASRHMKLDFKSNRSASSTSTLKFASLGSHVRFDTIVSVRIVD